MNIRFFASLACLVAALSCAAMASTISDVVAQAGTSALASGVAPGIAIAVVHNGNIVADAGYGFADVRAKVAVTTKTRFAIGSLTKQFTAAAIMLLVRDGKLRLDDTLATYVPSLPNAKRITLCMLLNQTTGLHNYPLLAEHPWPTQGHITTATILSFLAQDRSDFSPGSKWAYSNANYAALTAVIEKVSGESYSSFLQQRIFAQVGMRESGFGYAAQVDAPIARDYVQGKADTQRLSLDLFSGAGGIVSSAHDLALWDRALMSGTLLPHSDVAAMWSAGAIRDGRKIAYGMGWIPSKISGHREVWHNGLAPGAGGYCYNAIFPDDHLAIVVLTNGFAASGVPERIVADIAASYGIGLPPTDTRAPEPAANDNPKIDALAKTFWGQLANNAIDSTLLEPAFASALTPSLRAQIGQGIAMFGPVQSWTFLGRTELSKDLVGYRYRLIFASGLSHDWAIVIDHAGKIAGSRLIK